MGASSSLVQTPSQSMRGDACYGSTPLPKTLQDIDEGSSFSTDVSVLLVPWLVFAMCLSARALLDSPIIAFLCFLYGVLLAAIITFTSRERSKAWRVYSFVCFASPVLGLAVGSFSAYYFPPSFSSNLEAPNSLYPSRGGAMICSTVLPSTLALVLALGWLWPGHCLIGSSESFSVEHGWGWEPKATHNMHFGLDVLHVSGGKDDWRQNPPVRVVHDMLYHRAYWSGEPALDYAYQVANNHIWLGCLFAHPGHPFSRHERIFVLAIVSLLAVFPLGLLSVLLGEGLPRTICAAVLVTFPRNILKGKLLHLVVEPDAIEEEAMHKIGPKFKRLVMRHCTKKDRQKLYHAVVNVRQENAGRSAALFFLIAGLATALICSFCAEGIHMYKPVDLTVSYVLISSMDGLVFGFVLELIFQLCITSRPASVVGGQVRRPSGLYLGFFHRWWTERLEYGNLLRAGEIDREAIKQV